jgi:hypothetical protein
MTTNKIYINQSLVKDLIKYQNDELCGLVFHNKWILQQFGGGSKANDLGHYFEWLCTGALAKGESEAPIPETTKSGDTLSPGSSGFDGRKPDNWGYECQCGSGIFS